MPAPKMYKLKFEYDPKDYYVQASVTNVTASTVLVYILCITILYIPTFEFRFRTN